MASGINLGVVLQSIVNVVTISYMILDDTGKIMSSSFEIMNVWGTGHRIVMVLFWSVYNV